MDYIVKELGISHKNIFPTASPGLYSVVVHTSWLKKWLKNLEVDISLNNVDFTLQPGESVPYPWRKIFIKVRILKTTIQSRFYILRYLITYISLYCR